MDEFVDFYIYQFETAQDIILNKMKLDKKQIGYIKIIQNDYYLKMDENISKVL